MLQNASPEQLLLTAILNNANRKVQRRIQNELKRRRFGRKQK